MSAFLIEKTMFYYACGAALTAVFRIKGCRKVLYRLPELRRGIVENKTIHLVEGEKDVERLMQGGLVAITSSESSTWPDEFTKVLKDADIVIFYDMDKAGIERRDFLCKKLYKQVKRLRVVDLPGLTYAESHGKDVTDWLVQGHTMANLVELVAKAPDYSEALPKGKLRVISVGEFLDLSLPKREMLLSPWLPVQGLAMIYAKRGVGKTHVALGIAWAVALGKSFLSWVAVRPKKVLFIDGEMPANSIQKTSA